MIDVIELTWIEWELVADSVCLLCLVKTNYVLDIELGHVLAEFTQLSTCTLPVVWINIVHSHYLIFSLSWYQVSFKNTLSRSLCVSVVHTEFNGWYTCWMYKSRLDSAPVEPRKIPWLGLYRIGPKINQLYFKMLYKSMGIKGNKKHICLDREKEGWGEMGWQRGEREVCSSVCCPMWIECRGVEMSHWARMSAIHSR